MLKGLFKRDKTPVVEDYTVDELIVLERWDDAHAKLQARLKSRPGDTHARLRFAEVLGSMGRGSDALVQLRDVAQAYADDGFTDKAHAVLNKALRMAPGDPGCSRLQHKLKEAQDLTQTHTMAMDVLRQKVQDQSGELNLANVNLQVENLWKELAHTKFIGKAPKEQIPYLVKGIKIARFRAGNALVLRGDKLPRMYVVVKGQVEAKNDDGIQLRVFEDGDMFGESTLLEHQVWPAHYFATSLTTCLLLERPGLEQAMTGNEDPKQLLDYLRSQQNDKELAKFFKD